MTEQELKRIIDQLASTSINAYDNDDQGDALDYYYGRPYGNEEEGRSQVATLEVQEAIEWSLPGLIRVFVGGDSVAIFEPVGPEDEDAAQQETDLVNHVFNKENNGFLIMYDWLKDALLQRNGYIKVYWNEETEVKTEVYEGLVDMQLAEFYNEDDIKIVEHTQRDEEEEIDTPMGPQIVPITFHDIKIERTIEKKGICIENIPVEEIKVSKNARSIILDECDYVSHETDMKATDLLEMGVDADIISQLSGGESEEYDLDYERSIDQENAYDENDNALDMSMRDIKVKECYLWVDFDGDGRAEYRKVLKSGNFILINEEIDYCPIVSLTPVRMPHKHQGMSKADQVMPIQLVKSTLLRQMLDNLYLTNNPEKEVLEDFVNIDDLLSSTPGGIKRVTQMGSIREMAVPFTAAASMPMMDLLDTMMQKRTGVNYNTMAMDADVLSNSTKGAFMGALEKGNEQMELMARLLAETGVKDLFKKIHHLLRTHQDVEKTVKLRGTWVNVNPQDWRERNDVTISVGLGTASKDSLIQRLMAVAAKQLEAIQMGLPVATPQNYYKTMQKLADVVDLGDGYFTDPSTIPPEPQQQQPDPTAVMAQLQQSLTQMQEETKRMKQDSDMQVKQMELAMKSQAQNHKELMDKMAEATKRAELELKYDVNVPGSPV